MLQNLSVIGYLSCNRCIELKIFRWLISLKYLCDSLNMVLLCVWPCCSLRKISVTLRMLFSITISTSLYPSYTRCCKWGETDSALASLTVEVTTTWGGTSGMKETLIYADYVIRVISSLSVGSNLRYLSSDENKSLFCVRYFQNNNEVSFMSVATVNFC